MMTKLNLVRLYKINGFLSSLVLLFLSKLYLQVLVYFLDV